MPETDTQGAVLAAKRLMEAFAVFHRVTMQHAGLTIRAGLATAPDDGTSYKELVKLAEEELTQCPIDSNVEMEKPT